MQPPFDEGLANASLVHYTWGPIYYEGGSTKGPCIYKWEKREFRSMDVVVQVGGGEGEWWGEDAPPGP